MIEIRLRNRLRPADLTPKIGKVLGPHDYDILLTGPTRIYKPDGRPLAAYLPNTLTEYTQNPTIYGILHDLRKLKTTNRELASATRAIPYGTTGHADSKRTPSIVVGALDPTAHQKFCRLSAWTGKNVPSWQALAPLLRAVAAQLRAHVPDRYAAQASVASRTDKAWVVPGTPFTTVTVNNTYSTGMHTDKGDLDAGFSTIACLRRGTYMGGQLMFPEYRVAVDMHDGDLLLMDAHDWHANAAIVCPCGTRLFGPCDLCGAERISVVSYFRTRMAECGDAEQEATRTRRTREKVDSG